MSALAAKYTADLQTLVDLAQTAIADVVKYRSSAPGTALANGTVLAGGGIAQLAAAALADIGAAGGVQVSAVVAAGAATTATMNTLVAQAQAFRNDAQTYAAQAAFNGYAGSFATKAALGSAAGKANGVYLVKADESLSAPATGQPRAYRVSAGVYVDSWGVPLLTAAGGLDLAGPLTVARPPTNGFTVVRRAPPNAADIAAGFADWTEVTTRSPTGEGGAADNGWAYGFNAHLGPAEGYGSGTAPFFRHANEHDWRPGGGQRWYEDYDEMRGPGHTAIRRPRGLVFDKVANRALRIDLHGDSLGILSGDGTVGKLEIYNNDWAFGDAQNMFYRGDSSVLFQYNAAGTISRALVGLFNGAGDVALNAYATTGVTLFGNNSGPGYQHSTGRWAFKGVNDGTPISWPVSCGDGFGRILGLRDDGGGTGHGLGVDGHGLQLISPAFSAGAAGVAGAYTPYFKVYYNGSAEVLTPGEGYIGFSPNGSRWKARFTNAGALEVVNAA